ncbi:MAG TPA: DUF5683 domain-containing protein [Longimicrobiales bacterium]
MMTRALRLVGPLLLLLTCIAPAAAQVRAAADSVPAAAQAPVADAAPPADSAGSPRTLSPRGAFIRSLLVPGWGQAYAGSYLRGGIYFAAQTGSWYMLLKTLARLDEARSIERRRVAKVRQELLDRAQEDPDLQQRYSDPAALEEDIANDPRVQSIRRLVSAREEQREDWIAQTIFWTFASAADAYVNAHLADFPATIAAEPRPDGGVEFRVSVPAGGKR